MRAKPCILARDLFSEHENTPKQQDNCQEIAKKQKDAQPLVKKQPKQPSKKKPTKPSKTQPKTFSSQHQQKKYPQTIKSTQKQNPPPKKRGSNKKPAEPKQQQQQQQQQQPTKQPKNKPQIPKYSKPSNQIATKTITLPQNSQCTV